MLSESGHEVYHYGPEGSQVICTEHVNVLSKAQWSADHRKSGWASSAPNLSQDLPSNLEFISNASAAIKSRVQDKDFLLCPFGLAHQPVAASLKNLNLIVVEPGIGYRETFAPYQVYDSYAWMHFNYGKQDRLFSPGFYDAVIPNGLDMAEFPCSSDKKDYFVFVGRMDDYYKGFDIAEKACSKLGVPLYAIGRGGPHGDLGPSIHLGQLGNREKNLLVSRAKGLFCPTHYVEPFGMVAIEAAACGTPVICTDFGGFTETVVEGVTGYRCRTFDDFLRAARAIDNINPDQCRRHAENHYSLPVIANQFVKYFEGLERLYTDSRGWYAES
jgi:glycosyltransferase involved in cell wall biosynthesis